MKTFLKILAGIGALVVVAIIAVMFMTAGMSDTADKFFLAIKSNNYDQAYSFLSEDFKEGTSKDDLKLYMDENAFSDFEEANWANRSVNGGRGELVGSITTGNGGVVPVSLGFVKSEESWKIYSITKPSSGIQTETVKSQMPSEKEQIQLVSESMNVFAVSVQENSMKRLHNHVSNLWRKQSSVAQFDEIFSPFYQFGDSFLILNNHTPQFSKTASIDENGVLLIQGLYVIEPNKIHFEHKYIFEGLGWKLMGINVEVK